MGPAVQQSDSPAGGLHSETNEKLPHCAAWRKPIHTGIVHIHRKSNNLIGKNKRFLCFLWYKYCRLDLNFFPPALSGASENDCLQDQADSG